jgi:uncharacterized protein involved in copper resistance
VRYKPEELMQKVRSNLQILEQIAAEIFRMVSSQIHGTPEDMRIDPYMMRLYDDMDELMKKANNQHACDVVDWIKSDIEKFWLSSRKTEYNEFVQ